MNNQLKKNALRDKIRRDYIDNVFENKRRILNSIHSLSKQYQDPNSKYQYLREELDQQQLLKLFRLLPRSVQKIVQITNNHSKKVYPIIINHIQQFTSTFSETNLVEWSNYVYLIQGVLINYPENNASKIKLIEMTSGSILYRAEKLCVQNKMAEVSVLRNYFDYLVTLGQDLIFLNPIDMMGIYENITKVLLKICTPANLRVGDEAEDLLNSTLLLIQNILSLKSCIQFSHQQSQDLQTTVQNKQFECEDIKIKFLNQLFKNPLTIKNLTEFGNDPIDLPIQCEQILRLFINLTCMLNDTSKLRKIEKCLIIMIQSVVAQLNKKNYQINILTLRLINNIYATDVYFCSKLTEQSITAMIISKFGIPYLNNKQYSEETEEYQIGIQRQFISTLTAYVVMISDQKQMLGYIQSRYNVLEIIIESLRDIQHFDDNQLSVRCLEAVLIYFNLSYQFDNKAVIKYQETFRGILERQDQLTLINNKRPKNQKICTLCEQILTILPQKSYEHYQD